MSFIMFDSVLNYLLEFINHRHLIFATALVCLTFILLMSYLFIRNTSSNVFLLDFACYKPPITQMCTKQATVERALLYGKLTKEMYDFMEKTMERGGLGDSTYLADGLLREPPNQCLEAARREAEMAIFGSIDILLAKTRVQCKDIGILVVNCCIFNVVPSLSSMIVNRYKLRENVKSFNLSGMGCSAGLVAIGLTKQLLQVHHNSYALVVSTESITQSFYSGNDRSKFLINCLFRVGGAAILLSNWPSDRRASKYQLMHSIRTHTASSNISYNCIFQEDDKDGKVGVTITKDLLVAANKAIEPNVTSLGSLILPLSEQIRYLVNYTVIRLKVAKNIQPYVPNFKKATDHFFPHVGGKPVLDELQRNFRFTDADMEASRMTLYRFGNTSSSSVWYELAYAEAKGRIRKGDRVWQIAFGSGFKCSSAVWRAMRNVDFEEENPWNQEIDKFPTGLNTLGSIPYYFEPSQ